MKFIPSESKIKDPTMLKKLLFTLFILLSSTTLFSQEKQIEIVEETKANRLFLYALNKNEQDLDVSITVEGTNFRQTKTVPRMVRVPARSEEHTSELSHVKSSYAVFSLKKANS